MYASNLRSFLLSPIIDTVSSKCFRVWYHMRGNGAGNFLLFTVVAPQSITHSSQANLASREVQLRQVGHQLDIWYSYSLNIGPGRIIVGFETISISQDEDEPALVAIDDTELLDGTCSQQGTALSWSALSWLNRRSSFF